MSSRALRRIQREQEENDLQNRKEESDESEEDVVPQRSKKSAFDLLNEVESDGGNEESENENEDNDEVESPTTGSVPKPTAQMGSTQTKSNPKTSKKKKKKRKAKNKVTPTSPEHSRSDAGLDEIDQALKSLGASSKSKEGQDRVLIIDRDLQRFYSLLSVDRQHLNSLNEMKKLFGSVVLGRDGDETEDAAGRRQRNNQGVAISDFLSARYSRVSKGQGLAGLALRQNVFMIGKPEWPKSASGGLSMELVERADDFTVEYRFLHNSIYQRTQREFEQAVLTMDPQAMFHMVFNNPYHISSLLQTAEILKHQGDHSVAADLYERALYNFGRSVQSTFATALAEGKARMDFRRPENREFWLTAYRYIGALVQKGTFRTAYEWAKLLLSLDPEGDPYCVRLIIDQLAVRGGQSEHFINLASTRIPLVDWGQSSPNIQISLALAHYRTKQSEEAKDTLSIAVKDHPWIFARLFQQLDIERTPKSIWGSQPRSDLETYQTESYVARAKDIWNTPETISFLREVVEGLEKSDPPKPDKRPVSLDEARHALVSEIPTLIGAVPREYTTMRTTSSDPLPPPDSLPSYDPIGANDIMESEEDENDRNDRGLSASQGRGNTEPGSSGMVGLLGRALNLITGRATVSQENPTGPEESLGAQMGLEEVQVNNMHEYEEALNRGQWPVLNESAAPDIVREIQTQQDTRPRGNNGPRGEIEDDERVRRERVVAMVREAQSRRQATVEDETDGDESENEQIQSQATETARPQEVIGNLTIQEIADILRRSYDGDDANKRWLAGRGMLALKEFTSNHGTDEKIWTSDPRVDQAPVKEYVARLSLLGSSSDRRFILDYALKQGAGAATSEMIQRFL